MLINTARKRDNQLQVRCQPALQSAFIAILFIAFFGGCNSHDDSDLDELNQNQKKWQAMAVSDYQITIRKVCFCLTNEAIVVVVKNNEISEAFFAESGEYLSEDEMNDARTIDDYFDIARHALNNAEKVDITYDRDFGFPSEIDADFYLGAADDEVSYYILDFQ